MKRRSQLLILCLAMAVLRQLPLVAEEIPLEPDGLGVPKGWKSVDTTVGTPWGPGKFTVESGTVTIESTGEVPEGHTGSSDAIFLQWVESTDLNISDGFVQVRVRPNNRATNVDVAARVGGSPGVYFFRLGGPSDNIRIIRWRNDNDSGTLIDAPFPVNPGDELFVKAGAVGDQLSMKVWRAEDSEPEFPQLLIADDAFPTGAFGFGITKDYAFEPASQISANFADIMFFPPIVGDFNGNGVLDAGDIDELTVQSAGGLNPTSYDLNGDSLVDSGDIRVWAKDLFNTWLGDANLDGQFDSSDLVTVLASGAFGQDTDSVWSKGDFNGDGRTDTSDFVVALADGGFGLGPPPSATAAVPEPSSGILLVLGLIGLCRIRRSS